MANTAVNLTSLDFDTLKLSLTEYMRSQSRFQDVDFEGSNINVLLDVLSYNTYLNTFYMNMVASEMFLDSAQNRNSVVSHAKSLNYVPRSFRSSKAYIDLEINPTTTANTVVLAKGTSFTGKVGSNTFTFSIPETRILTSTNNTFTAANVAIYEGQYVSDGFIMDYSTTSQRFVLSSEAVDTDSISVTVVEDAGTTTLPYTVGTSLLNLTKSSQVCFLQAAENQKYEILFGDGTLGRKPQNGASVYVNYRVSSGELGNGAAIFTPDSTIDGHANVIVSTVQTASGGIISEDTESIRFNAPRYFQTQERAVTAQDYKSLLFARFPEITSVNVYGGENAVPPRYGKVIVSVDVIDADGVPEYKKNEYLQYVRDRCSLSIDPVFVDPTFMYVDITVTARYNVNATILTEQDVSTLVKNQIVTYSNDVLEDFSVTLRSSNLSTSIDTVNPAMLSNDMIVRPYITFVPTPGTAYRNILTFGNAIRRQPDIGRSYLYVDEQSVRSSTFTFEGTEGASLEDNGSGSLQIVKTTPSTYTKLRENVGTVDYTTGDINILGLTVDAYSGNGINIYMVPDQKDVVASKNVIMRIDPNDIHITVVPERL